MIRDDFRPYVGDAKISVQLGPKKKLRRDGWSAQILVDGDRLRWLGGGNEIGEDWPSFWDRDRDRAVAKAKSWATRARRASDDALLRAQIADAQTTLVPLAFNSSESEGEGE